MSAPIFTSLYLWPLVTAETSPYEPAQPSKNWIRPLESGENAEDDYVYSYYEPDASLHEYVISKGAAAVANFNPTPAPGASTTQIPIPCGPVPAGYQVESTPFGLELVSTTPPATDPTTRILNGVNAILGAMNLPQV